MLKKALLLLVFSSLFSQSAPVRPAETPKPYDDGEAYEIYSAIIPSEWPSSVAKAKTLVIRRETRGYQMCLNPEGESQGRLAPAISDYVKRNEKPMLLQNSFSLDLPYHLLTADELKTIFDAGSWKEFYKQYPDSGGVIELSAVGFNKDKTVAVVYMGHSCGGLCGGGGFHVLQKKDGKWVPLAWKGMSCGWES
jgi:hypothetical protein